MRRVSPAASRRALHSVTCARSTKYMVARPATERVHANCSDALCAYEICGYCYSTSLITHENSRVCVEAQKYNIGCHSCGRQNCFNASPTCHARCTASHHVCGPSVPGGCDNCGRLCHLNNSDPRCAYFQRSRGQLEWRAAPADLMDTVAGTGGTVPHHTQIKWNFNNATVRGRRTITVEGRQYYVGRGNPGSAANGEYNNCLIDSLRQCVGIQCSRTQVREDLMDIHGTHAGRAKVTLRSFFGYRGTLAKYINEFIQAPHITRFPCNQRRRLLCNCIKSSRRSNQRCRCR